MSISTRHRHGEPVLAARCGRCISTLWRLKYKAVSAGAAEVASELTVLLDSLSLKASVREESTSIEHSVSLYDEWGKSGMAALQNQQLSKVATITSR